MSDNNMFDNLFGGMGGDLFADFGEAPKKAEKPKAEKPKTDKKSSEKKEKKSSSKDSKAKEMKFAFPVTVRGRNFAIKITGEGEVTLQALVEKLVDNNLTELKHAKVKFAKMSESECRVVYDNLSSTEENISVSLPVVIADGQLQAEYTQNTQLELGEEDEPSVKDLIKAGLTDEDRSGLLLDYDATSSVAIPIYPALMEKDAAKEIKAGDRLLVNGEVKIIENASSLIPDFIGEIPDGWGVEYKKLKDGFYYLGLKPEVKTLASLASVDRTVFGIKAEKKAGPVKEMISLPVQVETSCPKITVTLEPKDFDEKSRVSFEEVDKKLHDSFSVIGKREVSNHFYNPETSFLEISYNSGKKGADDCA